MGLKLTLTSLLLLTLALFPEELFARAGYFMKADMIRMADAIALVTITSVEPTSVKGHRWTYKEVATAKVEKVLKGKLSTEIKLYGGEDFICAQSEYSEGRFLVFLKHDGELFAGSNWHFSIRPVEGENIEWYKNNESLELESRRLDQVLDEVENLVRPSKSNKNQ